MASRTYAGEMRTRIQVFDLPRDQAGERAAARFSPFICWKV